MSALQELLGIFDSVTSLTGIGVCIYDFKRFLSYESGSFQRNLSGHYCDFCRNVRYLPGGRDACIHCDTVEAVELAKNYRKPFFHTCHAGLCELILPLFYREELVAMVFLGQCAVEGETTYSSVEKN